MRISLNSVIAYLFLFARLGHRVCIFLKRSLRIVGKSAEELELLITNNVEPSVVGLQLVDFLAEYIIPKVLANVFYHFHLCLRDAQSVFGYDVDDTTAQNYAKILYFLMQLLL